MRKMTMVSALLWFLLAIAPVASAQTVEVDVELVLAVDVSRSMTPRELEIQRRGYAEALSSEAVIDAIRKGLIGRVAITYVEWAGAHSHRVVVDWTMISNRAEAEAFAARLTAHFDTSMRRTSISGAIDDASARFENNGFTSQRQVIDISGDGPNNNGRPVTEARDEALAKGIIINGLPLMTREGAGGRFQIDDLDEYYRQCVVGGPASFVIPVKEWDQFPAAVRQKLILELAGMSPLPAFQPAPGTHVPLIRIAENGYDCLIGEKIWLQMRELWNEP